MTPNDTARVALREQLETEGMISIEPYVPSEPMSKVVQIRLDRLLRLFDRYSSELEAAARQKAFDDLIEAMTNDQRPHVDWYREPFECVHDLVAVLTLKAKKGENDE